MFVDASAIVAILNRDPQADALADAIESGGSAIASAVAIFEAALGLCRTRHASVEKARTALAAFARYGKGRGHPAQLNLGDCFAYAVVRNRGVPLLFKGNDFTKIDIEPAV